MKTRQLLNNSTIKLNIDRALRSIVRGKYYSVINLSGLSLGLACSFLIMLYILSETGYDKCHENRNSIFRLTYFNPETEGKLTWMCGPDAEGKITSVFCWDNTDKRCTYLEDTEISDANGHIKALDKAKYIRGELIKAGWKKLIPPEITFSYPGETEQRPLTRKQKRALKRRLEKMNRKNPFNE